MLRQKTLFVLGAGASAEVGMPVGSELAEQINRRADIKFDGHRYEGIGDRKIFEASIRHYGWTEDTIVQTQEAAKRINAGSILAASIDDFLSAYQSDKFVQTFGKAAIVKCILDAESRSKIYFNSLEKNSPNWLSLKDTWYARLFSMMSRGSPKEDVLSKARFITFNYDRTLEHFLTHAMKDYFGIEIKEAAEYVESAAIVHPYGTAGTLDAKNIHSRGRFGYVDDDSIIQRADEILTYSEEMARTDIRDRIYEMVDESPVMALLGFAFHEQNVRLLIPPGCGAQSKEIYSTAYNISPSDCEMIAHSLTGFLQSATRNIFFQDIRNRMHINLTCVKLLEFYSKTLSS